MEKWIVSEKNFNLKKLCDKESLMCQGNGYIGIRNSLEEHYINEKRGAFINGVFNEPAGEVTELAVLPDVLNLEISINDEMVNLLSGEIKEYKRELNLKNGESIRKFLWTSKNGTSAYVEYKRIVSLVKKHIVAQKISITPLCDAKINLFSGIDGKTTNSGVQHFGAISKRKYPDGIIGIYSETIESKIPIAIHSAIKTNGESERKVTAERRGLYININAERKKNETLCLEKFSSYSTLRDFEYINGGTTEQVNENGKKYLNEAILLGYDSLFEESGMAWKNFWNEHTIRIESQNKFYELAMNFAQYHLKIMASGIDSRMGVGAKALSGEGYKGHSFWDTEMFILPYYIFNDPTTARKLLEYRHSMLKIACEKAKKYGFAGAMYPWECAWQDYGEACPDWGDMDLETGEVRRNMMGEIEIHINCDIAYGVWQYYCATKDIDFMEKFGCEIITLTAAFWVSRVVLKNDRYEILNVIGPDEYKDNVNNNAYTNYMAYFNMQLVLKLAEFISPDTIEKMNKLHKFDKILENIKEILPKMYLPKADKDGIIAQFDGIRNLKDIDTSVYKNREKVGTIFEDYGFAEIQKMQVFKQADTIMLLYALENFFSEKEIKENYEYYEKRTLHDSSLSMCAHALVASRIGHAEEAEKMFLASCSVDLGENTDNSAEGIHSASIGGIWLSFAMGFCGIRITENGLNISPTLPTDWEEYEIPICIKGGKIKLIVNKNGHQIERLTGEKTDITVNGELIHI